MFYYARGLGLLLWLLKPTKLANGFVIFRRHKYRHGLLITHSVREDKIPHINLHFLNVCRVVNLHNVLPSIEWTLTFVTQFCINIGMRTLISGHCCETLRLPHCLDNRLTVNCEILATCSSTYSPVRTSQEAHSVSIK
jgi:hypothetical protein